MNSGAKQSGQLRKVEVSILHMLRRRSTARFTELMKPTGLTSDTFKFYVRDLVKSDLIEKVSGEGYQLTPNGKALANSLDKDARTLRRQPKLSMLLIASRKQNGTIEYLFQKRLRHPFYGFWGFLSGPVEWGRSIEESAQLELQKQTSLWVACNVRCFCRAIDKDTNGTLLEDKLFAVVEAHVIEGELSNTWSGGENQWLTLAELNKLSPRFPLTEQTVAVLATGNPYTVMEAVHQAGDY